MRNDGKEWRNSRFNAFPLFPLLAFDQTSLNSYLEL